MPSGLGAAVELRLGKIRTGQAQNLVGFAQLAVLALQGLYALALFAGLTRALTGIGLLAANRKRSINPVLVDGVCFQEAKAEAGEQFHGSSAS